MTELLKKDTNFKWTEECEANFQELKKRLVTSPVLILPDQRKDYEVYCNTSREDLSRTYAGGKSCFICLTTS